MELELWRSIVPPCLTFHLGSQFRLLRSSSLFNLNVLEDERCELGSFNFAMTMKQRLELAMGFNLSAAELEHAVDGI